MANVEDSKERLERAEKALEYANEKLSKATEGILNVRHVDGQTRYLCRRSASDTNGRYLADDDEALIKALEEKAYCTQLAKVAAREAEALSKAQALIEGAPDHEAVYLGIPADRRHLIDPYAPAHCAVHDLSDLPDRTKGGVSGNYITREGVKVRSKSELILADKFTEAVASYRYEYPEMLGDEYLGTFFNWYPDFKVMNPRTGKVYFWEHFGMMDNPEYCASAQFKLKIYAQNGIFPGQNLIVTTESTKWPLDTEYVDMLIKEYLT